MVRIKFRIGEHLSSAIQSRSIPRPPSVSFLPLTAPPLSPSSPASGAAVVSLSPSLPPSLPRPGEKSFLSCPTSPGSGDERAATGASQASCSRAFHRGSAGRRAPSRYVPCPGGSAFSAVRIVDSAFIPLGWVLFLGGSSSSPRLRAPGAAALSPPVCRPSASFLENYSA